MRVQCWIFRICLLSVAAVAAACRPGEGMVATAGVGSGGQEPPATPAQAWVLDDSSLYYDYLSTETQNFVSENPHALAGMACEDLGGRLETLSYRGDRFGENAVLCVFEEPGMRELVMIGQIVQQ